MLSLLQTHLRPYDSRTPSAERYENARQLHCDSPEGKTFVCLKGVFTTRFNHRKLNKVVENAVRTRYKDIMLNTRIRENIALAESAGSGNSIFEYDSNSNGAKDYRALTEEIMNR